MSALVLTLAFTLAPQTAPAAKPAATQTAPADAKPAAVRVAELRKEFDEANKSFSAKYGKAKTDEERQKVIQDDYPDREAFATRFLAIAADAKGEKAALDSYLWVLQASQSAENKARCYDALLADHLTSPEIAGAVQTLGRYSPTVAAERFVRAVLEKSPHHEVKGHASYALAGILGALASLQETLAGPGISAENRAATEQYYGADTLAELAERDAQEMRDEAEDLLEDVVADYADVKVNKRPLSQIAQADLFEMRNLQIGKVAPEIVGKDLDGVEFKLSDYRGKVVVLDFWGFW